MKLVTGRLRAAIRPHLEGLVAALGEDDVFARRWRQVDDVATLLDLAFAEGVAALLLERIAALGLELPAACRDEAERRWVHDRLWYRRLAAAQEEVLGACEAAAVTAVVLKGPLLGERLYSDPALRPSADLDLLVDGEDMEPTCRVLEELGFRAEGPWRYHHLKLVRGDEHVELHDAASSGPGTEIAARPLLEAASSYRTVAGQAAWILSPVDELVYLAVHAARHRFSRLVWLYDLRLFVERHPQLDYKDVAERACSFKVLNALSVTAEVLRRRLGTTLPVRARSVLRRGFGVRLAAGFFARDIDRFFFYTRYGVVGREVYIALLNEDPGAGLRHWGVRMGEGVRKLL
jgi:hypothetical protein